MSALFFIGLVALVAAVVVARAVGERGLGTLSDAQKLEVTEQFSSFRKYQFVPLLFLLAGYFLLSRAAAVPPAVLFWVAFAALVGYLAVMNVYIVLRLRRLEVPRRFLSLFLIGRVIQLAGAAVFLFLVLADARGT